MHYTIESRELTNEYTHEPAFDPEPRTTTVEADDATAAIVQFVRQSHCELVSCINAPPGRETIATVKKNDAVFLVRIYTA